ncbi:MAG: glycosyltransferase [Clostridia bacterium]|nr:glycosyltransferase [Clostridia bacterium]
MNSPLISILVPVYNVEKYLRQCIDSIIAQIYKNIEIILVDDGSTDSSGTICDEYSKKDSRIKVIHQKNQGLAAVRNVGISAARGEYIGFVDSDDFIAPDMYSDMLDLIQKYEADLAVCSIEYTDAGGISSKAQRNFPFSDGCVDKIKYMDALCGTHCGMLAPAWNKLYKRYLFNGINYPNGKLHEDEAVIHHICHACNKIVCTQKKYYFYRQRSESIMNNPFTVKRFDNTDALIERVKFFKENGYGSLVEKAEYFAYNDFLMMCKNIKKIDKTIFAKLNELRKDIRSICKDLICGKIMTPKEKVIARLVYISPVLYIKFL